MLPIPKDHLNRFNQALSESHIPETYHGHYRKWFQYFLDYCRKYPPPDDRSEQIRFFTEKLQTKKQTPKQCSQAAHAISLYFKSQKKNDSRLSKQREPNRQRTVSAKYPPAKLQNAVGVQSAAGHHDIQGATIAESPPPFNPTNKKRYNDWRCLEKTKSPAWDQAINQVAVEIKTRHYSRNTLKTYANWIRKFQRFLRDKPPDELSSADVKEYLTYLAVKCRVASSTQNQAFNALLFLFRHVLKKGFWRSTRCTPSKKIEICSGCPFPR